MNILAQGLFSTQPVSSFPFKGEVFTLDSKTSINEAFHSLITKHILSAPVWDEEKQAYLGFFDVTDAIKAATGDLKEFYHDEHDNHAHKHSIATLFEKSHINAPWIPVSPSTPMSEVLKILATEARRVPVIDPNTKKVTMIISQSLITQKLDEAMNTEDEEDKKAAAEEAAAAAAAEAEAEAAAAASATSGDSESTPSTKKKHKTKMVRHFSSPLRPTRKVPQSFLQTPKSSGVGIRKVFTVDEETPAEEAFKMLASAGLSAVGVVDDEGKLLACITTTDIRLLPQVEYENGDDGSKKKVFGRHVFDDDDGENTVAMTAHEILKLPAMEFVSKARLSAERMGKGRPAIVVVTHDTPLFLIVKKLAKTKMHRLFIVDENHHPVGVISVSDIVKMLLETSKE